MVRGNESLEASIYQGQGKEAPLAPFIEETINTEKGLMVLCNWNRARLAQATKRDNNN